MAGGEDGECGLNLWMRKIKKKDGTEDYKTINLGGKNTASMKAGERIVICTPGGGGYGKVEEREKVKRWEEKNHKLAWRGGSIAQRESMAETN